MSGLKVLSVASEIFPLIKTGGLADVVGALPAALAREGVEMRTLVPGYPAVIGEARRRAAGARVRRSVRRAGASLAGEAEGLDLFAIDAPHLYDRPGNPYLGPDGLDWPDNARRFAALARVGADIGLGAVDAFRPQVVHAHDWQAALAPAYLHYADGPRPGVVITIHNIAFQGHFPMSIFGELGLPAARARDRRGRIFRRRRLSEGGSAARRPHHDRLADLCARDLDARVRHGARRPFARPRRASCRASSTALTTRCGIRRRTPRSPQNFSALRIDMRVRNKTALQTRLGLTPGVDRPLFGVVSRLSDQKGLDLLVAGAARPHRQRRPARRARLGRPVAGGGLRRRGRCAAGSVGCVFGYDEKLAHLFQAGADFILVPSRFEPCGLTQLCALRYGAPPIVARVGGLADTVIDANEAADRPPASRPASSSIRPPLKP